MEGLAVAIQQQRIRFPEGSIKAELEAFEYVYSRTGVHYSAPEGLHDDCVCALALAVSTLGKTSTAEAFILAMQHSIEPAAGNGDAWKREQARWR